MSVLYLERRDKNKFRSRTCKHAQFLFEQIKSLQTNLTKW
uniref:Uncharacterized protein n=1 Tax=Rhizophora mucronata TaxID=61149 RepID=A0A2P2IJB5_RHIMU